MAEAEDTAQTETGDGAFDTALSQFHDITRAQQEERALCLQDRRFVSIAGAQWEGDWAQQFANSIMVEVNKTAQGVEKIIADYRADRMIVDFRAENPDDKAATETADTLNGLFLADVYRSKGQQAFDGAFEEAVQGGMGAWRLCNEYEDEYDPDDDRQRISFKWIPDADQAVFWDMDARLYDKSDAKFCFVVTAMSPEAYRDAYNDDPASWPQDILKPYYDWYTPSVVRVAEYYRIVERTKTRLWFQHSLTGETKKLWAEDMDDGEAADLKVQGWRQTGRKRVKRRQVEKLTFSAAGEIAERQTIAGDQIPVVPVYGKRWFIDNMERVRGHVRLAKDPQRIYNAQISKLTETSSITPIERPIFTPEQVAGHENSWASANMDRAPYSLVNPIIGADGNPMPVGPIATLSPPQLPPVLGALIQITANDINELTTNADDAAEVKSNVSAEAMDIAATRTDAKTFTYMDNMRQSMQRCGEIYKSMAGDVYVEEGREVPTMDAEGQQGTATLLEPTIDDRGRMYLANDFSTTKLNVIADVTEATSTRRDKTVKALVASAQIASAFDPQGAAAMIGVAIQNMDGEGVADLKDWNRKRLVAQGIIQPTEEEKRELAQAAANQQPDPQTQVAAAQAEALAANAEKERALAEKAQADTGLSKAKTVQALADAQHAHAQATFDQSARPAEHRMGMMERVKSFFAPEKPMGGR